MTMKARFGETEDGIANVDIGANLCVKWHTVAGQIVVCGVGDMPCGVTTDPIPAGKTGTFQRAKRGNTNYISGSGIAAGDYVKCGAAGVLVPEASVGTLTAATVGQAKTASDGANMVEANV